MNLFNNNPNHNKKFHNKQKIIRLLDYIYVVLVY